VNRSAVAIVAFALAGALAAAGAAHAQGRPSPAGNSQGSSSGATHLPNTRPVQDPKKADAPVSLRAQVQETLSRTADDLRINGSQEKAWNAYATRVIRLADDITRARFAMRDAQSEGVTAPQLFDRIAETAQNRMTAVEEIVDAGRALYATLSPTQQHLADKQLAAVVLSLASGIAPAPGAKNDDGSPIESKPRP